MDLTCRRISPTRSDWGFCSQRFLALCMLSRSRLFRTCACGSCIGNPATLTLSQPWNPPIARGSNFGRRWQLRVWCCRQRRARPRPLVVVLVPVVVREHLAVWPLFR
jgi:hypothetical protein